MRCDNGRYVVQVDGLHTVAMAGGPRACFVIDGEEDELEFASTMPDAHLEAHSRVLILQVGQVVTTSPSGQPFDVMVPEV